VARRRLIDSLVSNLSVLSACVDSALGSDAETLLRHRTALKLYVFFLHWALAQAEAEAREGGAAAPPAAAAAKCDLSPTPTLIAAPSDLKANDDINASGTPQPLGSWHPFNCFALTLIATHCGADLNAHHDSSPQQGTWATTKG